MSLASQAVGAIPLPGGDVASRLVRALEGLAEGPCKRLGAWLKAAAAPGAVVTVGHLREQARRDLGVWSQGSWTCDVGVGRVRWANGLLWDGDRWVPMRSAGRAWGEQLASLLAGVGGPDYRGIWDQSAVPDWYAGPRTDGGRDTWLDPRPSDAAAVEAAGAGGGAWLAVAAVAVVAVLLVRR